MTYKEYTEKFNALEAEKSEILKTFRACNQRMDSLTSRYLQAVCPYDVGDVITNGDTTIIIRARVYQVVPHTRASQSIKGCYEFRGPKLTKKLVPFKNGEQGRVFSNRKLVRLLKAEERE